METYFYTGVFLLTPRVGGCVDLLSKEELSPVNLYDDSFDKLFWVPNIRFDSLYLSESHISPSKMIEIKPSDISTDMINFSERFQQAIEELKKHFGKENISVTFGSFTYQH